MSDAKLHDVADGLREQDERVADAVRLLDRTAAVIEEIMTQHWDMCACPCWICAEGRAMGLGAREQYLRHHRTTEPKPRVIVEICLCRNIRYPTVYVHESGCKYHE